MPLIDTTIFKGEPCGLLVAGKSPHHWAVNPHFLLALSFYFNGE